jgi:hypothetical protein
MITGMAVMKLGIRYAKSALTVATPKTPNNKFNRTARTSRLPVNLMLGGKGDGMRKNGIGSHHSAKMKNDEWLTPPGIIEALGKFDLDPCSPMGRPWDTAENHYTVNDDGLSLPWNGRVWLNPPYGQATILWLKRLADHGDGIALIFARTETDMFFSQVWERADAILFIRGRIYFHYVDGSRARANSGAPSCLIAYGERNVAALETSGIDGKIIRLTPASTRQRQVN